jgi:hypothetical protein
MSEARDHLKDKNSKPRERLRRMIAVREATESKRIHVPLVGTDLTLMEDIGRRRAGSRPLER